MLSFGNRETIQIPLELKDKTLDQLIKEGICSDLEAYCEVHNEGFTSKPIAKVAGAVIYSECPKCEDDRKRRRLQEDLAKENTIKARQREIEDSVLKSRGCGSKFLKMRDDLSLSTELMSSGLSKYLEHDGLDFKNKKNIIILGGCGIGKTFFANWLVMLAYKLKLNYVCLNAFEIASIYKSKTINGFNRTNSFQNLVDILEGVDCLIIDEVDYFLSKTKDIRDEEALHHASQICEKEGMRVILMGNCNRAELKEALPPKVYSRFAGGDVINGWNMQDLRRSV